MRERDGTRHVVILRGGRIVAARVAGRFDPLLATLRRDGAVSRAGWQTALEALGRSERRSGQLAIELAGVDARAVRAALEAQLRSRLAVVLERAATHGRDAWLEPRTVPASEQAAVLTIAAALAAPHAAAAHHTATYPTAAHASASAPRASRGQPPRRSATPALPGTASRRGARDRRALRRLAYALHPDRNAHLSPEARDALAAELASATAAFHRLGD